MDKLMMNKQDDMEMELDDKEMGMVAGGVPGCPPPVLFKRNRKRKRGKGPLTTFINNCAKGVTEGVDNLLYKVFGPPRKR